MKLFANRFLRGIAVAATVVVSAGLLGCAAQRLNDDGMKMISAGQNEQGLSLLARASEMEPGNSRFRIDYLEQQALAVRDLLRRVRRASSTLRHCGSTAPTNWRGAEWLQSIWTSDMAPSSATRIDHSRPAIQ